MAEILTPEKQNGKVFQKKKIIRVDMTPMVDLGFLLITFFMLATSFSKPNVMDLGLPAGGQESGTVIDVKNQITFIIGKDNRVFYYQGEKKI
jgi:biopolymer transport protein ExbD